MAPEPKNLISLLVETNGHRPRDQLQSLRWFSDDISKAVVNHGLDVDIRVFWQKPRHGGPENELCRVIVTNIVRFRFALTTGIVGKGISYF